MAEAAQEPRHQCVNNEERKAMRKLKVRGGRVRWIREAQTHTCNNNRSNKKRECHQIVCGWENRCGNATNSAFRMHRTAAFVFFQSGVPVSLYPQFESSAHATPLSARFLLHNPTQKRKVSERIKTGSPAPTYPHADVQHKHISPHRLVSHLQLTARFQDRPGSR
jgi:hypothetical protein